jgi:VCBS repeat-containing protein
MSGSSLTNGAWTASTNTKISADTHVFSTRTTCAAANNIALFKNPTDGNRFVPTKIVLRDASATLAALIGTVTVNTNAGANAATLAVSTAPSAAGLATVYLAGAQVGTTTTQASIPVLKAGDSLVLNITTPSAGGVADSVAVDVFGYWQQGV